nr:ABC transporter permease subunit [Cupriavidus oxalaticus]
MPLGTLAAYRRGRWVDRMVMGGSVLGFSLPVFVAGYLMIWLFSLHLGWFPAQGYKRLADGAGPWLHSLALPCVTLSVMSCALVARVTRAAVALYGARVSLAVGVCVALASVALGLAVGLVSGYFRWLDGPVMRVMDGMMAIPGILFAIVLVAAWRPSLLTVIVAMTVPDTPRVARLVRSVVLSVREEPYVEAAIALDTPAWKLMLRHILPNTIAPLLVQGTFICAGAMLVEAVMSFLGIGLPTDIPTWGNIMAEGRAHFTSHPHSVLLPGAFLALTVLAVNMLGDGLRDTLDPKFNKRNG